MKSRGRRETKSWIGGWWKEKSGSTDEDSDDDDDDDDDDYHDRRSNGQREVQVWCRPAGCVEGCGRAECRKRLTGTTTPDSCRPRHERSAGLPSAQPMRAVKHLPQDRGRSMSNPILRPWT
nr:hypothetical protein CFP56_01090 [Quercus suber]